MRLNKWEENVRIDVVNVYPSHGANITLQASCFCLLVSLGSLFSLAIVMSSSFSGCFFLGRFYVLNNISIERLSFRKNVRASSSGSTAYSKLISKKVIAHQYTQYSSRETFRINIFFSAYFIDYSQDTICLVPSRAGYWKLFVYWRWHYFSKYESVRREFSWAFISKYLNIFPLTTANTTPLLILAHVPPQSITYIS